MNHKGNQVINKNSKFAHTPNHIIGVWGSVEVSKAIKLNRFCLTWKLSTSLKKKLHPIPTPLEILGFAPQENIAFAYERECVTLFYSQITVLVFYILVHDYIFPHN